MCSAAARRVRETLALAVATLVTAVWATWPLARRITDVLPAEDRDPLLNAWLLAWMADRARHAFHGLWDAPILYPYHYTYAFSEHFFGLAPVSIPLEWLTRNPLVAYNIIILLSYPLAAVGMYLLVLELTGRRAAAIVAAAAFAFCPYRVAQFARIQIVVCGWLAVMMWGLHRYVRTHARRDLAIAIGAYAIQGLTNLYYVYYALVPVLFVAVWAWRTGRLDTRTAMRAAVVSGIALLVVFAPIAKIYLDARNKYDLRRDFSDNSRFSADVGSYLHTTPAIRASFPPARWLPDFTKPDGPLETKEGELFPGLLPLLLAIAAPFVFRRRQRIADASVDQTGGPLATAWRRDIPCAAAVFVAIALVSGWNDAGVSVAIWILLIRSIWPVPRQPAGLYAVIALWAMVLSLGPEPTAWGRLFFPGNPYALLFRIVPGLDGLRVPARVGVITSFALAVLAGLVIARIADAIERTRPAAPAGVRANAVSWFAAGATILVLADVAAPMPLAFIGFHGQLAADPLYRWLRTQPDGAVLELPIGRMDYNYSGFRYEYATLTHRHPIVNGWTGYSTPLQQFLGSGASPLRDSARFADALDLLDGLGVRYVIVHPADFDDRQLAATLVAGLRAFPERVAEAAHIGDIVVFRLIAAAKDSQGPTSRCRIDLVPVRATASPRSEAAALAFDGHFETRWTSGEPQTGTERFDVSLSGRSRVCGIRLTIDGADMADYPRRLRVEDASERVLFDGPVARQFGEAVRTDAARPRIEITWPAVVTDWLTLRQTAENAHAYWSINELTLLSDEVRARTPTATPQASAAVARPNDKRPMTNADKK